MKVFSIKQKNEWNEIVKTFPNWDVYFLCEYAEALSRHGDGAPYLFYLNNGDKRCCFVAMIRDISNTEWGKKYLSKGSFFDMETPYGYGGMLKDGLWDLQEQQSAYKELEKYCCENNIVTYFIRYSPWLKNDSDFIYKCDNRKEKQTIYIDTTDEELIFKNMDSKNRNMIRKAQKNGVKVFSDSGEYLDEFMAIYNSTMDNNNAADYYYFEREYFEFLRTELKDNTIFFYSMYDDKIIGAAMFLYNDYCMHYHLSGTYFEYRNLASTNLLLYEVALWANKKGIKCFHLGGGISDNDSLFGFKKQFNKNGYLDFNIGRMIFSKEKYEFLLKVRSENDPEFNKENAFLIQYRR